MEMMQEIIQRDPEVADLIRSERLRIAKVIYYSTGANVREDLIEPLAAAYESVGWTHYADGLRDGSLAPIVIYDNGSGRTQSVKNLFIKTREGQAMLKTKLKAGQTAKIFQKPLTGEDYEGDAVLVDKVRDGQKLGFNNNCEVWNVKFGNDGPYERVVMLRDVITERGGADGR